MREIKEGSEAEERGGAALWQDILSLSFFLPDQLESTVIKTKNEPEMERSRIPWNVQSAEYLYRSVMVK